MTQAYTAYMVSLPTPDGLGLKDNNYQSYIHFLNFKLAYIVHLYVNTKTLSREKIDCVTIPINILPQTIKGNSDLSIVLNILILIIIQIKGSCFVCFWLSMTSKPK